MTLQVSTLSLSEKGTCLKFSVLLACEDVGLLMYPQARADVFTVRSKSVASSHSARLITEVSQVNPEGTGE